MKGDPLEGECDHGVKEDNETHTAKLRFELPALPSQFGGPDVPGSIWCYAHRQWVDLGTRCVQKWEE